MVFKEHFAGDEIKDHAAGGRDDLGDHIIPAELINQEPEQTFVERKEGKAVKHRELDEKSTASFIAGRIENPSRTRPVIKHGRNRKSNCACDQWRDLGKLHQREVNRPVNCSIGDSNNDKFSELLKNFDVFIKMKEMTTPLYDTINKIRFFLNHNYYCSIFCFMKARMATIIDIFDNVCYNAREETASCEVIANLGLFDAT